MVSAASKHEPGLTPEAHAPGSSLTRRRSALGQLPPYLERDGFQLRFSRPPRLGWRFIPATLMLPDVPNVPDEPEPWQGILITAGAGSLLSLVLVFAYPGNELMLLIGAATLITSAVMIGYQLIRRASVIRTRKTLLARYHAELATFEDELSNRISEELEARLLADPAVSEIATRASTWNAHLWERRINHTDFLKLRLGLADLPRGVIVNPPRNSGMAALAAEGDALAARYHSLRSAPLCLDMLSDDRVVGIAAKDGLAPGIARAVLVRAAVLHGPDEVRIAVLAANRHAPDPEGMDSSPSWRWAKWLPHCAPPGLGFGSLEAMVASGAAERQTLLSRLTQEHARRRDLLSGSQFGSGNPQVPIILVVATSPEQLMDSPAGQALLEEGPAVGFRFIILSDTALDLPGRCEAVLAADASAAPVSFAIGNFTRGPDAQPPLTVTVDMLGIEQAEQVARAMAPLRPHDAADAAELPTVARLTDVLGLTVLYPQDVLNWWLEGERDSGIRAILGLTQGRETASEPLELDLVHDGPHGLIAGTTGSGKSELLLTIILSLAWRYHPHRLGGPPPPPTAHLPHTLGLVTDLDEQLANRCLAALKAELKRRERLLREHSAANISAYQGVIGAPPLPHLLVVVDELAQLLKEVPNFVDGLVNVAQTGRSLGVHLILATQKPEGVVTGPIQANANFRISLRVVDPSDSTSIIGIREAADIPVSVPGRAYLRIAQQAPHLFQAARVAGQAVSGEADGNASLFAPERRPPRLPSHLGVSGRTGRTGLDGPTDIDRLVAHICEAAESDHLERLPSPWPEPLPSELALCSNDDRRSETSGAGGTDRLLDDRESRIMRTIRSSTPDWSRPPAGGWLSAPIGLMDRPSNQWQGPFAIDLQRVGHLLVAGAFGSGAGVSLMTLATSLALTHRPDDLHVYALDFGPGLLRSLQALPHCGDVLGASDTIRIRRLIHSLGDMVAQRQRRLGEIGAMDWVDAIERRGEQGPFTLLLIENFGAFVEADEAVSDQLMGLLRDGRSVGLHAAISADQMRSVPSRLAGLFEGLLILRQSDTSEISSLTGLARDQMPREFPSGRGFWREAAAHEVQVADPVAAVDGESLSAALQRLGTQLHAEWDGLLPPPVRMLPVRVALDEIVSRAQSNTPTAPHGLRAPIGLDDDALEPAWLELDAVRTLLVTGPPRSGRSTALAVCVASLGQRYPSSLVHIYLAGAEDSMLQAVANLPHIVSLPNGSRVAGAEELPSLLERVATSLSSSSAGSDAGIHVLVIDDFDLLISRTDSAIPDALAELLSRGGERVALLAVGRITDFESRWDDVIRTARQAGHALVLTPRERTQAESFGASIPRDLLVEWVPGRAFYIRNGEFQVIQIGAL
jgi:DNA segregation ATPase FtsK/SpoIIIE, S-DNA-T family